MDWHSTIQTIAEVATALAVGLGVGQLSLTRKEQTAAFEQQFLLRYWEIVAGLPLTAMLGKATDPFSTQDHTVQRAFYDYFQLCDEEAFYHEAGRVSDATWADWIVGMQANMGKPAFIDAWTQLSVAAPDQFGKYSEVLHELVERESRTGGSRRA